MKSKIEELLDQLIEEMRRGKSIDECLRECKEYEDELRPLLHLAKGIESVPKPEPRPEAIAEAMARISEIRQSNRITQRAFSLKAFLAHGPVFVRALAIVLLVIIIGWTTVLLSAKSLPGDILYPMKTFTEQVQYFLTFNPEGKAELHLVFAGKRTDEFVRTLKPGEKLNRELLMQMLDETKRALDRTLEVSGEQSAILFEKLRTCNKRQMDILAQCEHDVCECDKEFIGQLIKTCFQQRKCIDCRMHPDSSIEHQCPCF
jgi:hypothetical protein